MTIGGKSMREHLEAINHSEAVDMVIDMAKSKEPINERTLKMLHHTVLRGIDKENAGMYRRVNVRIGGSTFCPPEPYLIESGIQGMFAFYENSKKELHPVHLAAEMHERLLTIHPFIDGNGRTSRLLMNLILLQNGYPLANIKGDAASKMKYYKAIHTAQTEHDKNPFIEFVAQVVKESLADYISLLKVQ